MNLSNRNELPGLLNRLNLFGTGVEVGVQKGSYSYWLLKHWKGDLLISVDPWAEADCNDYVDIANVPQKEHDFRYATTCQRLSEFGKRSCIWRTTSIEAANRIDDGSVDFVYLDARHDFESIKMDLEAWCRKIRPGGVFAGHDYLDGLRREGLFGVKSAVDLFFREKDLAIFVTKEEWPSWVVQLR